MNYSQSDLIVNNPERIFQKNALKKLYLFFFYTGAYINFFI